MQRTRLFILISFSERRATTTHPPAFAATNQVETSSNAQDAAVTTTQNVWRCDPNRRRNGCAMLALTLRPRNVRHPSKQYQHSNSKQRNNIDRLQPPRTRTTANSMLKLKLVNRQERLSVANVSQVRPLLPHPADWAAHAEIAYLLNCCSIM